jgi:hypothetical protein
MANFAQLSSLGKSHIKSPSFNTTGLLTGLAFLLMLAIAIYLASMSPGTSPDAFVSMTVFP